MERGFAVICAVVLAFTSHVCHAGKWQISPLAGYTYGGAFEEEDTGTDLNIEESPSLALAIDAEYEPDSQIEFYVSRQATEFKADPDDDDETGLALFPAGETLFDLDVYYIHIGGTYMWQERVNDFQPYIVGTLGVTHFVPLIPTMIRRLAPPSVSASELGIGLQSTSACERSLADLPPFSTEAGRSSAIPKGSPSA